MNANRNEESLPRQRRSSPQLTGGRPFPQEQGPDGPSRFSDTDPDLGIRWEAANRDRGMQRVKDPERGPSGK